MTENENPWMQALGTLEKLISAELLEVSEDDNGQPRVLMMQTLYDAMFFSDFWEMREDANAWHKVLIYIIGMVLHIPGMAWLLKRSKRLSQYLTPMTTGRGGWVSRRHWFDEPKALAFLEKVRFLINWRRGYVAGLRNYGQDELDPKSEEDMLRKLYLGDEEWITFYVLGGDYKPLIMGRWKKDKFELKTLPPAPSH